MKKIIIAAAAALVLMAASCSKAGGASETGIPKQLSDSISEFYGKGFGTFFLNDYINYVASQENAPSKDDIIKGIQIAMSAGDNEGIAIGLQIGTNMKKQIKQYEAEGIEVNTGLVLKNFIHAFKADTVDVEAMPFYNSTINDLLGRAHEAQAEFERRKAQEEVADAREVESEYFANLQANDPEVQKSPSGLYYKIIEKGDDTPITDQSAVNVLYVGSLTDGTIFDQTNDGQPATFAPTQVIPGFGEGLKMLGNGGKAILYIPGELAYGENGIPQAGIGPNATLVFNIEVVGVSNPDSAE